MRLSGRQLGANEHHSGASGFLVARLANKGWLQPKDEAWRSLMNAAEIMPPIAMVCFCESALGCVLLRSVSQHAWGKHPR
eukprot:11761676-Alexandrium_andersonii.AAC.1